MGIDNSEQSYYLHVSTVMASKWVNLHVLPCYNQDPCANENHSSLTFNLTVNTGV